MLPRDNAEPPVQRRFLQSSDFDRRQLRANTQPTRAAKPGTITGERVMSSAGGFNPTWQRHVAAYATAAPRLGQGKVLDLGCGVGHSYELLSPRETVGVDIDPGALAGQQRETVAADMRDLPFADAEFAAVLSVHSIEHVPDPEEVIDEAARVLVPEGVAIFVTPNRLTFGLPDEIIDPYHHVEFDQEQLRELCASRFDEVEVAGLFGSARYMQLFEAERVSMNRMLKLDPLRLRHLLPRRAKQAAYDLTLRRKRRGEDPRAAAITPQDFELRTEGLADALDLIAICRGPRT